jgi:hypothetical protein
VGADARAAPNVQSILVLGNQLGETNLVVVVLVLCTATLKAI